MRIRTTCRPMSGEYTSVVDLARRGNPPPYARQAKCINWMGPGGIVWVFVSHRIALLLVLYGVTAGGFAYGPARGIPYSLPTHRLRDVDLVRLVGGQVVLGSNGLPVIDPATSTIAIYALRNGNLPELKYQSGVVSADQTMVYILMIDNEVTYCDLVKAMDEFDSSYDNARIWLAPAGLGTARSNQRGIPKSSVQ